MFADQPTKFGFFLITSRGSQQRNARRSKLFVSCRRTRVHPLTSEQQLMVRGCEIKALHQEKMILKQKKARKFMRYAVATRHFCKISSFNFIFPDSDFMSSLTPPLRWDCAHGRRRLLAVHWISSILLDGAVRGRSSGDCESDSGLGNGRVSVVRTGAEKGRSHHGTLLVVLEEDAVREGGPTTSCFLHLLHLLEALCAKEQENHGRDAQARQREELDGDVGELRRELVADLTVDFRRHQRLGKSSAVCVCWVELTDNHIHRDTVAVHEADQQGAVVFQLCVGAVRGTLRNGTHGVPNLRVADHIRRQVTALKCLVEQLGKALPSVERALADGPRVDANILECTLGTLEATVSANARQPLLACFSEVLKRCAADVAGYALLPAAFAPNGSIDYGGDQGIVVVLAQCGACLSNQFMSNEQCHDKNCTEAHQASTDGKNGVVAIAEHHEECRQKNTQSDRRETESVLIAAPLLLVLHLANVVQYLLNVIVNSLILGLSLLQVVYDVLADKRRPICHKLLCCIDGVVDETAD
jgi:hypothetical protein